MMIKRGALEAMTMFPVGLYIGAYPVFKFLQNNKKNGKDKKYSEMWYSLVFTCVYKVGEKPIRELKERLFASLSSVESVDEECRKEGIVRALEVGPGFGGNFKFYPPNTRLTTVEIKEYLEKNVEQIREKYPNITFNQCIIGTAEDMKDVPDNSIDVIIGTLIFCCIDNYQAAMKEMYRVLAKVSCQPYLYCDLIRTTCLSTDLKGGKLYFMEAVTHHDGTFQRKVQKLYKPFWKGFTLGCKAGEINVKDDLQEVGFTFLESHEQMMDSLPILLSCFNFGIAVK
ncbi:Methyltransferase-like protein 7B [Halotydeus destructor]|nr:Methyltransferase-like protein 7B [Halotydeus destructor]